MSLISIILAVFRGLGYKSQAFQAIAHLWVGCLIGIMAQKYITFSPLMALICFAVLCVVEITRFAYDRWDKFQNFVNNLLGITNESE